MPSRANGDVSALRDRAAIVGIGHTEFVKDIGRPERVIALEAITAALDDAGLSPADVDGLEQLGHVAVTFREHAQANPYALMRGKPMTMDDYLAARWVSEPLRLFDCCLETDGALAVVLVSAERARSLRKPPVLVRAAAQGTGPEHLVMANYFNENPLESPAKFAAEDLWRQAGMGPDEIDCA